MERWYGKVAVVTGASSGIGEAVAETLTKVGMKVVGLARREERVKALADKLSKTAANGKLYALKCDMQKEEDILKVFASITTHVGPVHILVNNAGTIHFSSLSTGATQAWRSIFETNVLGLCIATREAIKIMTAHQIEGHIVHVNSAAGQDHLYFPTYPIGAYGASKHAVTNLTKTLRREMIDAKTNIKVTSVSPGAVRTELFNTDSDKHGIDTTFGTMPSLASQDVADAILYVLSVPPHVHINELTLRAMNSEL